MKTDLEQSHQKKYIVTKFKDTDRNSKETDIKAQLTANMTQSYWSRNHIESRNHIDSRYKAKNDTDMPNNKKYVFPNASDANILK